jgi:hypothetical protein
MLSALFNTLSAPIVTALLKPLTDVFQAYFNKQVSEAELREKLAAALLAAFVNVEKAYADSIARTFSAFMQAASQSRLMQAVWGAVALSQLLVLLWHQVGIPALVQLTGHAYASSGATVDWAYALVMFCLGGGAIALKSGPAASALKDQLRGLAGR